MAAGRFWTCWACRITQKLREICQLSNLFEMPRILRFHLAEKSGDKNVWEITEKIWFEAKKVCAVKL